MNFTNSIKEKLLAILVNRTVIFFFCLCLLTLFLYATGTVQGFIDTTQFLLLSIYVVLGIFLTITSIGGIVINMGRYFSIKKIRYLIRSGGYMLLMIFGSVTVLTVMFIITLSSGNGRK